MGPGAYVKAAPVWAGVALSDGEVCTNEGVTRYLAGDYLVSNDEAGDDAYAISAATFEATYTRLD